MPRLLEVVVGVAAPGALGVLFVRSAQSSRETPFTAEQGSLAGWTLVVHPDADALGSWSGAQRAGFAGLAARPRDSAASKGPEGHRADGIEGGVTRNLTKGEIIVVPAMTPHWMKGTKNPRPEVCLQRTGESRR